MKNFNLLTLLLLFIAPWSTAQERYIDDIATEVDVQQNVIYGVQATVAPRFFLGDTEARPRLMNMDVYTPNGDTETARPLIILLHSGNFLPPAINGGCSGSLRDNDMVNFANRLAKKGYVVASADYRIGWNPLDSQLVVRRSTLINAAYRGMQDLRTAVRYFRKTAAENNNPYGIDPEKVVAWGFGTGGYISYAAATVDTITDTWIPKFFAGNLPMVIEEINGNVDGTSVGIVPENYPGFPAGDTLNYPNHVGYSSDIQMGVSAGGALGDLSWIDENDPPYISYHVTTDPFAPCGAGTVIVPPPTNLPVVPVDGGCTVLPAMDALNINEVMDVEYVDDISMAVNERSGGVTGFFPFEREDSEEAAPWNFSLSSNPLGLANDPGCSTDSTEAQMVVDSMIQFFAPRACLALDLGCSLSGYVSTKNIDKEIVGLNIMPNPAQIDIRFEAQKAIQSVYIYDVAGRLVKAHVDINNTEFVMQRNALANGLYFAQVRFAEGYVTQKISFN